MTVPGQDVDTIVTEYGIAELQGKTIRDRTESLIRIAHPDFRPWIRDEVERLGIVPGWSCGSRRHEPDHLQEETAMTVRKLGNGVAIVGVGISKFGAFADKTSRDLFVEA